MKQRDIFLADLEPVQGSEQGGVRPVVVISGNSMNKNLNVAIVCCLSSVVKHYMGCVQLKASKANGLTSDSEVVTFQIRTMASSRLKRKLGVISVEELQQVLIGLGKVFTY
jgi:mRNA interferase MazF